MFGSRIRSLHFMPLFVIHNADETAGVTHFVSVSIGLPLIVIAGDRPKHHQEFFT